MLLRDFRWARYPFRHRSSDPTGRASESEGYVRAGLYQCSSPDNLISSSHAISKRLQTFGFASTPPESRGGRLPRRCFLAWCTQFQITHVFLEAVIALRPLNFLKTCESLLTSRLEPGAFTKIHRHRAIDASSFSRLKSPPQTHGPASATRISVLCHRAAAGLFLARLTRSTPAGREKTARRPSGARPARRCSPTSRAPGACATPRRSSNWSNARAGAVVVARGPFQRFYAQARTTWRPCSARAATCRRGFSSWTARC